jgi:hypothetical protein
MRWASNLAQLVRKGMKKSEGKRPQGRPWRKINLTEMGWGGMQWTDLAQDGDKWRALVNEDCQTIQWREENVGECGLVIKLQNTQRADLRFTINFFLQYTQIYVPNSMDLWMLYISWVVISHMQRTTISKAAVKYLWAFPQLSFVFSCRHLTRELDCKMNGWALYVSSSREPLKWEIVTRVL